MVDDLAQAYARAPKHVVFIEHDLENLEAGQNRRRNMWYAARNGGNSANTPMILIDSGAQWLEGAVQYDRVYKRAVDEALARPPQVQIDAYFQKSGATADLSIKVTNWSEETLTPGSGAQVSAILYEDKKVLHTGRIGRAVVAGGIGDSLEYGESGAYRLQFTNLAGVTWSKAHIVVLVEHRSGVGNAYESLQAAMAVEGVPPTATPTATATETPRPTDTPVPTDPPPPTATDVPRATDEPTATPVIHIDWRLYVPAVLRRFDH